jgi:hypothetical protein
VNKYVYGAFFLLLMAALLLWCYQPGKIVTANTERETLENKVMPVPDYVEGKNVEKNVLNLALPKTPMLFDPVIALPQEQHDLKNIFNQADDGPVTLDARLLIDENPEPNAGVWDSVKGAEVGITIKTH